MRAEARVRKETQIAVKPSRLYIDVLCDPTTGALRELIYEDGDSRQGTLRIVWLREIDRGDWNVRVIESVHARGQRRVELKGGTIKALELRAPVDAARVALHVRANIVPIRNDSIGVRGTFGTTGASVYARMTVDDEEGHVVDRVYAGLLDTGSQIARLPIVAAIATIDDALAKPKNKLGPIEETDEDRAMYLRRLPLALALPAGESWIKERYVNLATTFGTVDAIPLLAPLLAAEPVNAGDNGARESALDAIAAITGWNPRVAPDGKERTTAEAAAIAADECSMPPASLASSTPAPTVAPTPTTTAEPPTPTTPAPTTPAPTTPAPTPTPSS